MTNYDFSLSDQIIEYNSETETEINLETESEEETEIEEEVENENDSISENETETFDYSSQLESLILIENENQQILLNQYNALHGISNIFVFSLILFLGGWIAIKVFLQLF